MATQSSTDLANLALLNLGSPGDITNIATDATAEGIALRFFLDVSRKSLLRSFIWNFAKPRVKLELPLITNAVDNGAGLIRVTRAAHGFSNGNKITISQVIGVEPANGSWIITVIDPNTFDLQGSIFAGAYQSGGYVSLCPAFEFIHQHALPADFLRLVRIETPLMSTADYRLENGLIVTDNPVLEFQYIKDVTDYTTMDPLFYLALSYHLAYLACYKVTQSNGCKEQLKKEFRSVMSNARNIDSVEDPMKVLDTSEWLLAREGGVDAFVRDPMTN